MLQVAESQVATIKASLFLPEQRELEINFRQHNECISPLIALGIDKIFSNTLLISIFGANDWCMLISAALRRLHGQTGSCVHMFAGC